ncbi:hypothetical protein Avbf_05217 [Armadillidium vulgare]|nr:hypothetical protein Avbf_05217 [Armadillidium vulgare]
MNIERYYIPNYRYRWKVSFTSRRLDLLRNYPVLEPLGVPIGVLHDIYVFQSGSENIKKDSVIHRNMNRNVRNWKSQNKGGHIEKMLVEVILLALIALVIWNITKKPSDYPPGTMGIASIRLSSSWTKKL